MHVMRYVYVLYVCCPMLMFCLISPFFSGPAKVAATATTTGKRGRMDGGWFLGFPTPHEVAGSGWLRVTASSA